MLAGRAEHGKGIRRHQADPAAVHAPHHHGPADAIGHLSPEANQPGGDVDNYESKAVEDARTGAGKTALVTIVDAIRLNKKGFKPSILRPLSRMTVGARMQASGIREGCGKCGACLALSTRETLRQA